MKPKDVQERFVRDLINCQPALHAYILSLLPNRNDANDVLQDVNLVMWRRSDEFTEGTNFVAWAYKIRDSRSSLTTATVIATGISLTTGCSAIGRRGGASRGGSRRRRFALEDCMEELPPHQRELVREHHAPGGSVRDMARRLGQWPRR